MAEPSAYARAMRRFAAVALSLIAAVPLLAGCSTPRPDDCIDDFPGARVAQILGDGASVTAWGAVKSRVQEALGKEGYYVAIKFHAAGYDGEGVWLSYGLNSGAAESLDAEAAAWSGLPRSANFDGSDKQADEARGCVREP